MKNMQRKLHGLGIAVLLESPKLPATMLKAVPTIQIHM